MGRLTRWLLAGAGAGLVMLASATSVAGFDGFGEATADSTYGREITFEVELEGTAPDRLELLVRTPGAEGAFVVPVEPDGDTARYRWDTSVDYLTPNTVVTHWWRAIEGDEVSESAERTHLYEDDREGLDWQRASLGEATVHWYGDAESQARRFGELTAEGVARAEALLGTELAGPVDVFVYETSDDFFGALGPGAREWTGAVAYSDLRTIFMMLEGQSSSYLEVAMVHEVTHIVFHDATDNPYHEPPRWLNEGIATWSESGDAGEQRGIVAFEASGGGLFSFDAITEQFPIGQRGAELSYAQGTTMVDEIIDRYGAEAMARMAAAYRDGATDEEALEAGTGVAADQLYADFFTEFGVDEPQPIAAEPIGPSTVDRPSAGTVDAGGATGAPEQPPGEAAPGENAAAERLPAPVLVALLGVSGVAALGAAAWFARRAARRAT
jgi:hypothetical protein